MALENLSLYAGFINVLSDPTISLKLGRRQLPNKNVFAMTISKAQGKVKANIPITGPEGPRGFQEVKVSRFRENGTGWW